jgi:hypothetical protein
MLAGKFMKIYCYLETVGLVVAIKVKSLYESATHNCKHSILISSRLPVIYAMCGHKNLGKIYQSTISCLEQKRYAAIGYSYFTRPESTHRSLPLLICMKITFRRRHKIQFLDIAHSSQLAPNLSKL